MAFRYAIYFSPSTSSALGSFGASWLGRSIEGRRLATLVLSNIAPDDWEAATRAPRGYGFHATLKPPFRLAPETTEAKLIDAMKFFCRTTPPVTLGTLAVQELSGFLALRPERDAPVTAFAENCVRAFDCFRAPPTPEEIARRRPETLTSRQRQLLDRWGYPYVMDEFRFHMTLTGRLNDPETHLFRKTLETRYAPLLDQTVAIDEICLFCQKSYKDNFVLAGRYTLTGK